MTMTPKLRKFSRTAHIVASGGWLAATVLSVFKPWGVTPYGRRKQEERSETPLEKLRLHPDTEGGMGLAPTAQAPRWAYVVAVHAVVLGLLFVVMHVAGGGMRHQ